MGVGDGIVRNRVATSLVGMFHGDPPNKMRLDKCTSAGQNRMAASNLQVWNSSPGYCRDTHTHTERERERNRERWMR